MSATLDAERFSEYFGGSPIIRVPGFTYPVQCFSPVLWYKLFVLSVLQCDVVLIFDYFRSNLSTWRMFLRL